MLTPVFAFQNRVLKKIHPEEIMYFKALGNYIKINLLNGHTVITRSTISEAVKKFPRGMFIKIHRSYAVSIFHIDNITHDNLEIDHEPIPIGKQFYKSAIAHLTVIGKSV